MATTERGGENFRPREDERETLDIPASDAPTDGPEELDWQTRQAGTDVCWWCKKRRSVADIADCEAPDGIGRCE